MEVQPQIISAYKPKGMSSHRVIALLRKATGIKKIGHAGTLDPLASGVLVVAIGKQETKRISEFMKQEKEYVAAISLDAFSETDDAEGIKTPIRTPVKPTLADIKNVVQDFIGVIDLVPPRYSAIKISGTRAYKLARKGRAVDLKPRKSEIKDIKILSYEWPALHLNVRTGSGVYIRSLARAIGEKLATGGYILELERTRVGSYTKESSVRIDDFETFFKKSAPENTESC